MQKNERRVAALEQAAGSRIPVVVIVEEGETQADALKRTGLQDTPGVQRAIVFGSPLDARL